MDNLLYHYSTQEGLLGIIQNREIWATNLLFLNDSMEFNYAIQLFKEYVEKIRKEQTLIEGEIQFLEKFCDHVEDFSTPSHQSFDGIYTCSFSENMDQLSQWRGYCPDGSGYSIGFDFEDLLKLHVEDQGFRLVKCVYKQDDQIQLINKFTLGILDYYRLNNNDWFKIAEKVWNDFLELAPTLKDPKFIEESEWRLVSKPKSLDTVEFRARKSMLIPYIKIRLTNEKRVNLDCIHKIYFGPTLYPVLTRVSLENFLKKEKVYRYAYDFGDSIEIPCEVVKSDIPYRVN